MRVAVVPAARAEDLRKVLHGRGIVDRTVRMAKRDGAVLIPLTRDPPVDLSAYGARLEDRDGMEPRPRSRDPREEVRERLRRYGVPDGVATDTITRNNRFLEAATGHTAKERAKKAQDAAKKGKA